MIVFSSSPNGGVGQCRPVLRRVLITTDTVGGIWSYALELAEGLGRLGIEVGLAAMGGFASRDQRHEAQRLPGVQLFESEFKLEWMDDPWIDVAAAGEWLLEIESRFRPDVVHLNDYVHAALPWHAPVLVVAHSCVCSWFAAVRGSAPPVTWARYRQEVGLGLAAAGQVVVPSAAMLQALHDYYGYDGPSRVIYNGRKAGDFRPLAKEPFIFSAVRLWDESKNLVALDAAAQRLAWPVHVAGETRHPDGGEVRPQHVDILGPLQRHEMAGWLGHAMIYALPAFYEPFGLTALEAARAGCVLVLGNIPSLREVWGEAAVLVEPRAPEALAGALERLMHDTALREEYARRARVCAAHFTLERMTGQYIEVYRELLEQRHAVPVAALEGPPVRQLF